MTSHWCLCFESWVICACGFLKYLCYTLEADMEFMYTSTAILFVLGLVAVSSFLPKCEADFQKYKNVLFLAVDDLRPELCCYGYNFIKSPNIDMLASKSMLFERAYCQVAVCSPLRASLMTGRRPDTNQECSWSILAKLHQCYLAPFPSTSKRMVSFALEWVSYSTQDHKVTKMTLPPLESRRSSLLSFQEEWEQDSVMVSFWWDWWWSTARWYGDIADHAVSVLKELHQNRSHGDDRPFFLGVGFHKPHPFYAPSRYYDLYPPASEIKLPNNPNPPEGMPDIAWSVWDGLRHYSDISKLFNVTKCSTDAQASIDGKECRVPNDITRELRRAYSGGFRGGKGGANAPPFRG